VPGTYPTENATGRALVPIRWRFCA